MQTGLPLATRLGHIADAWGRLPDDELSGVFPRLRALHVGWWEPFCFRCGWSSPPTGRHPRTTSAVWNYASGWLERAHLQDRDHGGTDDPLNLAPLCALCHQAMPECRTRADGIAHVNTPSEYERLLWIAQAITDRDHGAMLQPGKDALRCLLRAYAEAGLLFAEAAAAEGIIPPALETLAASMRHRSVLA